MKFVFKQLSLFFILMTLGFLAGCASTGSPDTNQDQQVENVKDASQQIVDEEQSTKVAEVEQNAVEGPVPQLDQEILMVYYVKSGDTLTKIAKNIYGTPHAWKKLAKLNSLNSPDTIYAGQVLHYSLDKESKDFATNYENAQVSKIVVKQGDTLSQISTSIYGKSSEWRILWKQNPQIKNPNIIIAGQELVFRSHKFEQSSRSSFVKDLGFVYVNKSSQVRINTFEKSYSNVSQELLTSSCCITR